MRCVHHRGDVWSAGISPRRCGGRNQQVARLGGAVSGAGASGRRLFARQGAMEKITRYYESRGVELGELRLVKGIKKADLAGTITLAPPSATSDVWTRRFPDPVTAFASGWMRVRARARQRGIELPLVISDHADWNGLTATIDATGAGEIWVTHGQEDALVHWCTAKGLSARPLDLVGYGDDDEGDAPPVGEDAEA